MWTLWLLRLLISYIWIEDCEEELKQMEAKSVILPFNRQKHAIEWIHKNIRFDLWVDEKERRETIDCWGNHEVGAVLEYLQVMYNLLEQYSCMAREAGLWFKLIEDGLDAVIDMMRQTVLVEDTNQAGQVTGDMAIAAEQYCVKTLIHIYHWLMKRLVR